MGSSVDARTRAVMRSDFDWMRNRAGKGPNSRLKARLKEASDSYPMSAVIFAALWLSDVGLFAGSVGDEPTVRAGDRKGLSEVQLPCGPSEGRSHGEGRASRRRVKGFLTPTFYTSTMRRSLFS